MEKKKKISVLVTRVAIGVWPGYHHAKCGRIKYIAEECITENINKKKYNFDTLHSYK